MAEEVEEGSASPNVGNRIKDMLTRKVGGIPVWVLFLGAILILAWYLRKRAAAKQESAGGNASNALATTAGQTFPYAYPMNYSSDVFVNNQTPATSGSAAPMTITVKEGTHLPDLLTQLSQMYPGLTITEDKIKELNPNLPILEANKYGYISSTNPANAPGGGPVIKVINTGTPSTTIRIQ